MKRGIVAVDLFCGAGGLTRGLLDAGIAVKKGYDIDPKVKETYEKNNPGVKFYHKDVSDIKAEEILEGIDRIENYFLLAGCAPCQPFSNINQKDKENDKRKSLILQVGRLITRLKPDFILIENVPGLKNGKGKHIFDEFEAILDKEGYSYTSKVLDAKDYGVPQKRRRLILLGSKITPLEMPEPTHGPQGSDKKPYRTVEETISKYPPISAGKEDPSVPNHRARQLSELNKLRLKHIRKDGGSRSDLPKRLVLECHNSHKGHGDVYGRMAWKSVAPTLTCKCTSISNGRFGHPSQTRGISLREAAALQTFSDNYIFYGAFTEATKWVGNAVPVEFTRVFGDYFISLANPQN